MPNSDCNGCSGTFTDGRDGQVYRTAKMPDGKIWMAQNLNYKPESGNSWCYRDNESMGGKYGRLYDWDTAISVAPAGWHLPTREEWEGLLSAVDGGDAAVGKKLKSKSVWQKDCNGTDDYGFSALPGGLYYKGKFAFARNYGFWWTATEYDGDVAYHRSIFYSSDDVYEHKYFKTHGRSVRYIAN
ncbi:MAG: fibrobacter succinogenes major paralogous domain-containing protein [Chitinispirillales bacterium]|jgi:uncharacterized protein (TIGR02145 family)|nr:fibrobacter succinogenes major paralogous domain-containing protein [Chitinispirillales bacterium]